MKCPSPAGTMADEKSFKQEALGHIWLSGQNATDHDLLPELRRAREARAKLKHAILAVSLKKRIAALKTEESDSESSEMGDAEDSVPGAVPAGTTTPAATGTGEKKSNLIRDRVKDGAVFREVVLGAVRDKKAKEEAAAAEKQMLEEAKKRGQL